MPLVVNANLAAVVASNHFVASNASVQKAWIGCQRARELILLSMMPEVWG